MRKFSYKIEGRSRRERDVDLQQQARRLLWRQNGLLHFPQPLSVRVTSSSDVDKPNAAGPRGGVDGPAGHRRRPVRADYGSDLSATLGEGALVLVRVLVAAERLRAVKLAVAVRAAEEAERLRIRVSGKEAELSLRPPLHFSKAS
ncbi:unnamed protein product [Miscanthus lutarioriparius]|uniref:Uncharacterized protein n=1 Tax=Miscanthus lutarioriparius TaxID=422564 RepID=A0A811M645_9POAL|nr:unnamed protein product [Miscanthus lutarioriparius]